MKNRKGQEGQLFIEGLLLMCVMVAIIAALQKQLKDSKVIPGLVTKPWARVAGMAENGVWAEPDETNRKNHPNTFNRFYTPMEY